MAAFDLNAFSINAFSQNAFSFDEGTEVHIPAGTRCVALNTEVFRGVCLNTDLAASVNLTPLVIFGVRINHG